MQRLRETLRSLPPFARAYVSYTRKLEAFVTDLHSVMTLSDLAAVSGLGWDSVKDIVMRRLEKDYAKPRLKDVRHLAIDEFYSGKTRKFYTIAIDLESGRILWVARGRGGDSLTKFWRALRKAKAKVKAVACDMSAAYWSAVLSNLPKADLVFDRFHLVKLVNEKLDELRRALVREAVGPLKKSIKGTRYLLLTRKDRLKEEQLPRLEAALRDNEPLLKGYLLKEALCELWNQPDIQSARRCFQQWLQMAQDTGIALLQRLAMTFRGYTEGILAWWKHRISSGRMEGINNKIRTMQRKAYGLRDERYFILKLYSLHHSSLKLIG